jgi:hypothetical protein
METLMPLSSVCAPPLLSRFFLIPIHTDERDAFTFPTNNPDSEIAGFYPKIVSGRIVAAFYGLKYHGGPNLATNNLTDVSTTVRSNCGAQLAE